jgi:hypothetical protein
MTATLVVHMPFFDDWPLIPPILARLDAALTGAVTDLAIAEAMRP